MKLLWSTLVGLPILAPVEVLDEESFRPDAVRVARTHVQPDGLIPEDKGTPLKVIGHVSGVFVDPEKGMLLGLLVGYTQILPFVDVRAWATSHLEIHTEDDLVSPDELVRLEEFGLRRCFFASKKIRLRGKGARQTIGRLRDFVFDSLSGALVSIISEKRLLFWHWDERIFPASDIYEITDNAIVLNFESLEKTRKENPSQFAFLAGEV